jgi:hypothetical protein
MVHEVENIPRFFNHVPSILKEQGDMLVAEPKVRVTLRGFHDILQHARETGLLMSDAPKVRFSRAALLSKNRNKHGFTAQESAGGNRAMLLDPAVMRMSRTKIWPSHLAAP